MCLAIIASGARAPEPAAHFGVYRM